MFCENCGTKLADNAKFCQRCGAPVRQEFYVPGQENGGYSSVQPQTPAKKKIRKWPFILAAVILILIACVIGGILVFRNKEEKSIFAGYVVSGQRYLEEMDYEKAEDAYLKAMEIDPKQAEPYLRLADIYVAQNDYEKAEEILKKGSEETESSEITDRYSLYEYTEDVLIPGEGECKEGEYTCEYTEGIVAPYLENAESLEGVLTSRIRDFDGDGSEELLVLILKNEGTGVDYIEYPDDYTCHKVYLRMYEVENGEVVMKDETPGIYPVLGAGDNEEAGIFLKESSGKTYICGSSYNLIVGGSAPSPLIDSFVMIYDGNTFTKLAGYDEPIIGSDFYGDSDAEEMADLLDSIGLGGMTSHMRDSYMAIFDFSTDEYDEMLMYVTGENDGSGDQTAYYNNRFAGNTIPELLGKVIFTLQLTWDKPGDEFSEQNSSDIPETPDYLGLYGPLLDETNRENNYNIYYICDIDKDGVQELLLQSGSCEAEYMYEVYTISGGNLKDLGSLSGGHTGFYLDEEGGTQPYIIRIEAHMGGQRLYRVSIQNGSVREELISEKSDMTQADEYYTNDYPVPSADVEDKSLLP